MKIMFAGASGVGKTTLAKEVPGMIKFDVSEYPPVLDFISGSVSDLIPKTKDMSHKEMLERDSKDLLMEDFQVMNLRNKMFRDRDRFVTDRSYLDLAAYFYYKQAKNGTLFRNLQDVTQSTMYSSYPIRLYYCHGKGMGYGR